MVKKIPKTLIKEWLREVSIFVFCLLCLDHFRSCLGRFLGIIQNNDNVSDNHDGRQPRDDQGANDNFATSIVVVLQFVIHILIAQLCLVCAYKPVSLF